MKKKKKTKKKKKNRYLIQSLENYAYAKSWLVLHKQFIWQVYKTLLNSINQIKIAGDLSNEK